MFAFFSLISVFDILFISFIVLCLIILKKNEKEVDERIAKRIEEIIDEATNKVKDLHVEAKTVPHQVQDDFEKAVEEQIFLSENFKEEVKEEKPKKRTRKTKK